MSGVKKEGVEQLRRRERRSEEWRIVELKAMLLVPASPADRIERLVEAAAWKTER